MGGATQLSVYIRAMNCDYLIVGQGIAGTTLAQALMAQGAQVQIIDAVDKSSSSRVAAGLFNPIVFKRLTFSWRAKESLKEAHVFYRQQEALTGLPLFFPAGLHRIHGSEGEVKSWNDLRKEELYEPYLGETEAAEKKGWLNQRFGGARLSGAGFIDTRKWIEAARKHFISEGILRSEHFEVNALEIEDDSIRYKDIQARKVIFCEGAACVNNPWFGYLPFNLAKGDVLLIHAPELKQEIFNGPLFGVPLGDDVFRVGSTYIWNIEDALPTAEGRLELERKLQSVLNVPYTVIGHEAGIRPTVKDRRPLLGIHPKHPALGIFNGLGTKGVMLAPLLAKEYVAFLLNEQPLSSDVDIVRYAPLAV
ncbi:MAG: hypothetical protein RLZZ543_975 [Bacteroidota bacterium]